MKCFISHSFDSEISQVKEALYSLNVEIVNNQFLSGGLTIQELIKKKIKESDFILGVIDSKNENVLFELGIAYALNKKIFLITDKDFKSPTFLDGVMQFQTNYKHDTTLLKLSLKNYIQDLESRQRSKKRKSKSETLTSEEITKYKEKIQNLRSIKSEVQLIEFLTNFLTKINVKAVSELKIAKGKRVDIAISSDHLSDYFGNPIIIEVKRGNLNKHRISGAIEQLQLYMMKSEAKIGILLYFDESGKRINWEVKNSVNIIILDIEDFVNGIIESGFDRFLIDSRNRLVHNI